MTKREMAFKGRPKERSRGTGWPRERWGLEGLPREREREGDIWFWGYAWREEWGRGLDGVFRWMGRGENGHEALPCVSNQP